jgi:hypothetical protein
MSYGRQRLHRVPGYSWYDWETGEIDRLALVRDVLTRRGRDVPDALPAWAADLPASMPGAKPVDLARLDARVCALDDVATGYLPKL